MAVPSSGIAHAQAPPDGIVLVNADRDFVERKKKGEFVARPVFDRQIEPSSRHPGRRHRRVDKHHVPGHRWREAAQRRLGVQLPLPALKEQPELDPDRAYLLAMLVVAEDGERDAFHAVVPIYEPGKIWDRILAALSPARWAKAFAGWVIEGVHGTLCGVVERASGEDADNCGGGRP